MSSPWRRPNVAWAVGMTLLGGLLVGYSIGFVPILLQYNQFAADCALFHRSERHCRALTDAGCVWMPPLSDAGGRGARCAFPDHNRTNCTSFPSQDTCKAAADAGNACHFQFGADNNVCVHDTGWNANQQGMLAGAMIIGSMFSSPAAGPIADKIGRCRGLALAALLGLLACAAFSCGWASQQRYGLLVAGEVLIGFAGGLLSVICPMYVGEMAPRSLEEVIGMMFQVAITFGIMMAGTLGLALDPRKTPSESSWLQGRFQVIIGFQWLTAAALVPVAAAMPESSLWLRQIGQADGTTATLSGSGECADGDDDAAEKHGETVPLTNVEADSEGGDDDGPDGARLFSRKNLLPVLTGTVLSISQCLTGINAIMVYAPDLTSAIGFDPLVGNFLVTLWNFLTTFLSIPLVKRLSSRRLFIWSTAVATAACFAISVPVFPGVAHGETKNVLGGIGILVFIAAFEAGLGPCLYVLAQDIFPPRVRAAGCSYTMMTQFLFNVVVNWGFPVSMTAFSGGPSGDQDKGLSICFLIFGSCGVLCTIFMVTQMKKTNGEIAAERRAAAAAARANVQSSTGRSATDASS